MEIATEPLINVADHHRVLRVPRGPLDSVKIAMLLFRNFLRSSTQKCEIPSNTPHVLPCWDKPKLSSTTALLILTLPRIDVTLRSTGWIAPVGQASPHFIHKMHAFSCGMIYGVSIDAVPFSMLKYLMQRFGHGMCSLQRGLHRRLQSHRH